HGGPPHIRGENIGGELGQNGNRPAPCGSRPVLTASLPLYCLTGALASVGFFSSLASVGFFSSFLSLSVTSGGDAAGSAEGAGSGALGISKPAWVWKLSLSFAAAAGLVRRSMRDLT